MTDENDSFEEQLVTEKEMVAHGKKIGASHLLVCSDGYSQDEPSAIYVMPGECVDTMVERAQGGCAFVHVVDLEEEERTRAMG